MYEGTESEITLLCENELMTYVIDRFGESVPVTPADEDHFYTGDSQRHWGAGYPGR